MANIIKQYKPEYAMLVSMCAGCAVILMICAQLMPVINEINEIFSDADIDSDYVSIMLKAAGICYISYFGSSICTECGQASAAGYIKTGAQVSIAVLSLPVITELINTARSILSSV